MSSELRTAQLLLELTRVVAELSDRLQRLEHAVCPTGIAIDLRPEPIYKRNVQ